MEDSGYRPLELSFPKPCDLQMALSYVGCMLGDLRGQAVPQPDLRPILAGDVGDVAAFLHAELNSRLTPQRWAEAIRTPWPHSGPNHGFMLTVSDRIVGVHLAFYSEREIEGRCESFCNLGAWCVLPEYRSHGLRLIRAVLKQKGYHFTDLSPSGNVIPLNVRLKFEFLDTDTALVPSLPWPSRGPGTRVVSDPHEIEAHLGGEHLRIYRDHRSAQAAKHVVLIREGRSCYVMFRRDRRKRLPVFASLLHVSDPALFGELVRPFARHLLTRHGVLGLLAEQRFVSDLPRPLLLLSPGRRRMFKSGSLEGKDIDYLYSELTCVAW